MNSWRWSSVMWPVAVSVAIAVRHSSSVSSTSVTNAWRWRTSACMTSRRRGSSQPAKLASTAAVMSAGVVRPAAVSGEVMRRFCRRRQGFRGAAALWAPRPAMRVSAATRPGMGSRPVGSRPHMSATSSTTVAARLDRIPPIRMHKRMAVAVGFANFFDLYDIFLGGVLAAVLAEEWGLGTSGKALVIASGFGGMFFGAILLGTMADYVGRRRMFLINLMIYSGFSLAAAFSPNLAWLAILCFFGGFGLGSELSLSDTYLSELLPRQVRGRYMAGAYTLGFFGGRDGLGDLPAAVPAADDHALHLPVPADRGLLRLRDAGAARARRQGLRHRGEPGLLGPDLPRLPARLGGVRAAHGALRAQAPHRRLGARDGRARRAVRLRPLDGRDRRRRLPAARGEQRFLERFPHLPGRDFPDADALDRREHVVLAEPPERRDAAVRQRRRARPSRPDRGVPRLGRRPDRRRARRRAARPAQHGVEPRDRLGRARRHRAAAGRRRPAVHARGRPGRDRHRADRGAGRAALALR